jgi:Alcohol dehydrogenase GroES-like domain
MPVPAARLTMLASGPGAAEVRLAANVPVQHPGPGQVLLWVDAASVNFSDVKRRRGGVYPFPTDSRHTPGGEIAGTVAACDEGVDGFVAGSQVLGLAGGVGQYAVQIARRRGALLVIATASSPARVPRPRWRSAPMWRSTTPVPAGRRAAARHRRRRRRPAAGIGRRPCARRRLACARALRPGHRLRRRQRPVGHAWAGRPRASALPSGPQPVPRGRVEGASMSWPAHRGRWTPASQPALGSTLEQC